MTRTFTSRSARTKFGADRPEIEFNPTWNESRKLEEKWRAMDEVDQPHMVCYMGMLSYKILSVHDTEAEAGQALTAWQNAAQLAEETEQAWLDRDPIERYNAGDTERPLRVHVPGYTREAMAHEFQVCTQASLDELAAAIRSSY